MTQDALADSAGPSSPPPQLPEGWLAQWEGVSRKWYYVQRTTGQSQWEVPTSPLVLTPSSTPMSTGTGPSQAPPPRPSTSSPPMGGWPVAGSPGPGPTGDADRGVITDFLTSHIKPQQGGLAQMALGVIGRFSNSGKPGSQPPQHNKPNVFHQGGQQQNSFGYSSNAPSGVYTGAAPQYRPQGQSNMTPAGPQQTQSGTQQFNSNPQGALSAPFGQNPSQSQTAQSSNTIPTMSSTGNTTPSQALGQVGGLHTAQPQWQGGQQPGQQPPLPMETKPSQPSSQVGLSSPAVMELPAQNAQNYGPPGSSDVQMNSNSPTPQPPGPRPPSSNQAGSFASPVTTQSSQPPPNGILTPGNPQNMQAGASTSFQPPMAELAGDMPGNAQGPPSQTAPNHGHANSVHYGMDSGPPPPGSNDHPPFVPPNAYAANGQYPNYPPQQPAAENGFGNGQYPPSGPGYNSAPPIPMGHYGNAPYAPPPNQPNTMWNSQPYQGHPAAFPPRPMTSTGSPQQMNAGNYNGYHPAAPGGPPDHFNGPHGSQVPPPQHGYQAYHPSPSQAPGYGDPWGQPSSVPPRTAPSDPQFVSGPFTSGTPSHHDNTQRPYGGYSGYR